MLDWANEVAGWSDDHPRIASAWRAIGTDIEGLEWDGAELERYRRFAKREAESRLLRIVEGRRESLPEDAIHLIEGHPAEALPAFTAGRTTDLIVMGTLTRPDAIGDMLGETAESVIRQVTCSVLTVPPGSHPDQDMRADDLRHAAGRVLLDVEGTE